MEGPAAAVHFVHLLPCVPLWDPVLVLRQGAMHSLFGRLNALGWRWRMALSEGWGRRLSDNSARGAHTCGIFACRVRAETTEH